jgi:hypothetical protein
VHEIFLIGHGNVLIPESYKLGIIPGKGKGSQPFGCGPRLAVWYNLWLDLELAGRLSKGLNKLPM